MTTWLIYADPRSYPKHPVYEGDDEKEAAKAVLKVGNTPGAVLAIRTRWKGKVMQALSTDFTSLAKEIRQLRREAKK